MAPDAVVLNLHTDALEVICNSEHQRRRSTTGITVALFCTSSRAHTAYPDSISVMEKAPHGPHQLPNSHCARLQVKKSKLPPNFLRKQARNCVAFQTSPTQRIADLDNATRHSATEFHLGQLHKFQPATKSVKHRKRFLLLPRTEKGSSTSSDERCEEHYAPSLPPRRLLA